MILLDKVILFKVFFEPGRTNVFYLGLYFISEKTLHLVTTFSNLRDFKHDYRRVL